MPILSRTVLCGAIVACISSAATVEAFVQLPRRGIETYDAYQHKHSSVVMVGVLLVLIVFTAMFILFWYRSRQTEDSAPCHAWQDLEKQKAMHSEVFQKTEQDQEKQKAMQDEVFKKVEQDQEKQKAMHDEVFQKVELNEPVPAVVHSTKKNRSTDTWDKYLSMIKSPSRLNSIVGKMGTMNKNL